MRNSMVAVGAALTAAACTTVQPSEVRGEVYDPFEGWNRGVYAFNEGVDKAVLEPVAKGYRAVTNEPVRGGVTNFLRNLNQPVVFANAVLQGKPEPALDTLARFFLNSTVGVAGIFDPATSADVPRHTEDFGQTLGVWGVPEGPYLMLPFMGPSNLRDAVGGGVDTAFDPLTWSQFEGDTEFRITRGVVGAISVRERLIEQVETLREQPEPYVALKRNYTQQRQAAIRDGEEEADPFKDLPDFDDFDFGDEEQGQ